MLSTEPLVMQWRWLPVPPPPVDQALPARSFRDDAAFFAGAPADAAMAAFRFSFPQLARQTPELRFYRLIQIFNTPLLSITSRDAGRSGFALWGGQMPAFQGGSRWAHFWFFRDGTDGALVALEYGFEGGLTIRSDGKTDPELHERYAAICKLVVSH